MQWRDGLAWFLAPSLLLMTAVLLYPLGYAIYLSFFDYYLPSNAPSFVGLDNYLSLLGERRFWDALSNTFLIAGGGVALEFLVGLTIALGLNRVSIGAKALTILMFLPHVVTPVVAALFLRWIFVGQWGLIDATLWSIGVSTPDWLGDPYWAKVTVILADAWKFTPFMILILYAGLQSLDQGLLEAATLDGARGFQLLYTIILPLLRPLILFVLAIRLMDAFRYFDTIYVMTGGGPGTATETLTLYTYAIGFKQLEIGRASALGILTLAIVAGLVALLIAFLYRRERGAF